MKTLQHKNVYLCFFILFIGSTSAHARNFIDAKPISVVNYLGKLTESTVEYKATQQDLLLTLSLNTDISPNLLESGITTLFAINGLGLDRSEKHLLVTDTVDSSSALVLQFQDLSLKDRIPSVISGFTSNIENDSLKFEADKMGLYGVIGILERICQRPVLRDNKFPKHVYSAKGITSRMDLLTSIDEFLSAHSIVLFEINPSFLILVYSHDTMPDRNPDVNLPENEAEVMARMKAVSEIIRKRRAAAKQ